MSIPQRGSFYSVLPNGVKAFKGTEGQMAVPTETGQGRWGTEQKPPLKLPSTLLFPMLEKMLQTSRPTLDQRPGMLQK